MDALSFHMYTPNYNPEITHEKYNKRAIVAKVKEIMAKYGYGDMKVLISEMGYSNMAKYDDTEVRQAKYELRDFALLYNDVEAIIWYNGIQTDNQSEYEHALGHIKQGKTEGMWPVEIPYEAKPVYLAMSNFNALLANAQLVKETIVKTKQNDNVYDYVFNTVDNKTVHMLWTEDKEFEYTLEFGCKSAVMYDMYGNSRNLRAEDGKYKLALSGEPVYIQENEGISVKFKTSAGVEVANLDNLEKLAIEVTKNSVEWNEDNAVIILAAYDNGRMKILEQKAIVDDIDLYKWENVCVKDVDKIQVMLWNKNLKPLIEVKSIIATN